MLARLDLIDDPQAADIRAEVLEMAGKLETLAYWIACLEWREEPHARLALMLAARGSGSLH
jgi:hypothetical protein